MIENEEREFMAADGPITFGNLKLLQLSITQVLGWLKEVAARFDRDRDDKSRRDIEELTAILLEHLAFEEEWLRDINAEATAIEDELIALINKL